MEIGYSKLIKVRTFAYQEKDVHNKHQHTHTAILIIRRSVQMQRKHFKCQKVEESHSSNFCNKDKGYRNPVYLHSNHLSFIFGINLESFLGK